MFPLMLKSLPRIQRQTWALMQKNFRTFAKFPVTTLLRALIFPILVTTLLCLAKRLWSAGLISSFVDTSGIATSSRPISDLADAINTASSQKLVFVRNGVPAGDVDPLIDGIMGQPGMQGKMHLVLNEPKELFGACRQTLRAISDCFAAVIFTSFNETSAQYIIAVDESVGSMDVDYRSHSSVAIDRLMPLQWAVDSHIGNFTSAPRPAELPWQGYLAPAEVVTQVAQSRFEEPTNPWLYLISVFLAPIFILSLMGIVYHLSLSVATERQSGISELLAAHTCTTTPRILATLISFTLLYLPSWIACSILITRLLFTRCSDILFLFLSLLAGLAITSSTHFVASFFRKAQLSGLYTSTLVFALAFVTIAFTMSGDGNLVASQALSLLFPPITYVTLVGDVARTEARFARYSLSPSDVPGYGDQNYQDEYQEFAGYLYIVFFVIQITVYTAATFGVERYLWGVTRKFNLIDATSDIAVRCTNLCKTFDVGRRWYWPFRSGSASSVLAVDGLDLELKKGSVTFLLGPNGGGKTTTLKCVAGMTVMDPVSSLEINEDGLAFGICPQGNVFWPELTVMENINIWRKIKTAASNIKEDEDDALVECDMLDKMDSPAKSLSGGQMRKLQLAIAFVGGSKVCCVDEASSGLDPLSRRNIWNIISNGHARRTVLMTTHFLDEADVLADHIAIMYKGKMVCAGSATSLKASYGDKYAICEIQPSSEREKARTWHMATSAEATRQVLELESLSDNSYSITFPTLEQVFLKVTQSGNIAQNIGGDGAVDQEIAPEQIDDALPGNIQHNIDDFDAGQAISLFRQINIILRKRYILLRHNWISFSIALLTPIIIAGALSSVLRYLPSFRACQTNFEALTNASFVQAQGGSSSYAASSSGPLNVPPSFSMSWLTFSAVVGPPLAFNGSTQDQLYLFSVEPLFKNNYGSRHNVTSIQPLTTRANASSLDGVVSTVVGNYGMVGFGLFAPTPENSTILHQISTYGSPEITLAALSVVTNRIANTTSVARPARKLQTSYRTMRHANSSADYRILPLTLLVLLGLLTSTAVAVIYPTFERVNNMRALQYCNGVSPAALWIAYLIFDMQVTIVTALVTWGLLFTGNAARLWFAPSYILGAILLFGIATYLGVYVLSTLIRRAAFAVAAGIHVVLFVLYMASYVLNQYLGSPSQRAGIYDQLQAGLGLTSPAANLARAFFITTNNYDLACGDTGYAVQSPFAYNLYGGVYLYLVIQILFLSGLLFLIEYGSMEWFQKLLSKKSALGSVQHGILEKGSTRPTDNKNLKESTIDRISDAGDPVLVVSEVSKHFGKISAVENASFSVSSDETLALLGANGAGKTTMINMIRGLIKPNHGSIHLDDISVIDQPQKARIHMGVCPQDDAIDELTVRQTLSFFALIKGIADVNTNIDKIMKAFHITQFEKFPIKKLSGGTRRKLMVAVALIGNPRVLLLDEPSTGLDAGAKRVLWKILHSLGAGRAVLLTTHSMEEVEALANKVTIIGTRMLASGSLPQLRNTYGGFYRVRASYGPEVSDSEAERLIVDRFQDKTSNLVVRYGEANFELPHETRMLGKIMRSMEGLMAPKSAVVSEGESEALDLHSEPLPTMHTPEMVFKDYTITEPTMDMIFMNVCLRAGG